MAGGFLRAIAERFRGRPVDWDELESLLLQADLGVKVTTALVGALRAETGFSATADEVEREARARLTAMLPPALPPLLPVPGAARVVLMVGVNGTGKTTSIAKLAALLKREGRTVMMAAGDTFRAAAIEQLAAWGTRLGVPVVCGEYQGDPAAVCHDALEAAARDKMEFLLCDTAGRLHTKHNLMQELAKIKRVLGKKDASSPHEILIVLDATTGSNALEQARQFKEACGLTGAILTKLDGSGRGGMAVALQQELGVPVRFVGTGEKETDFARFDPKKFAAEMF
ncbi:MAG: signal recognition particle-docking protein FtsY [Chthoniobacterales bacterium]|jgi:fused signal recognition particle receptor|nr:signal recognition particle-docking protein FtsY [Chthoniobacterales bacterium]